MHSKFAAGRPGNISKVGEGVESTYDLTSDPTGKFNGNELKYLSEALNSANPDNKKKPWNLRFESAFSKFIGSQYCIAHNSGTSALHSCMAAAGVGPDDEVIMPALTVIMDAYAAIHLGGIPVFAEVDPDTQNIDPEDVKRKITKKTKAIITVSLQGLPADVAPIMQIAQDRRIIVVEDCAQTMAGRYDCTVKCPGCTERCRGKHSGTIGHLGAFSFESKKHLSTGEGGMVVTDDPLLAEKVRKFGGIGYRMLRPDNSAVLLDREVFQSPNYERFDSLGLNYRMPEFIAAIGLAQLERVHELVERRRKVASYFAEAVKNCSWMVPQSTPIGFENSYYTFSVKYLGEDKFGLQWKDFWRMYRDRDGDGFYGACRVPYLEPVFQKLAIPGRAYGPGLCPVAESIQKRIMQFKTNYRDLSVAHRKAEILVKLIDDLGRK